MQEMDYGEFHIEAIAVQTDKGKWIGQATITATGSIPLELESPLTWPQEEFDSPEEAESFALESAQRYIEQAG